MMIARIFGGLGNQLFQYAAARAFATRANVDLKLDTTAYEQQNTYVPRVFGLPFFQIPIERASAREIALTKGRSEHRLWHHLERLRPYYRRRIVREPHMHFAPGMASVRSDAYLDGYWQSEKYFYGIEPRLRQEFMLKRPLTQRALLRDMASTISVALHVRRGDYISNTAVAQTIGSLPLDFYHAAIAAMQTHHGSITLFVFSDDLAWVRTSLKTSLPVVYVSSPEIPDYEELVLMSRCRHQIIANSSFSWWAAWLNGNPNKTVIAPKQWFRDPRMDARDIVPESWIRL